MVPGACGRIAEWGDATESRTGSAAGLNYPAANRCVRAAEAWTTGRTSCTPWAHIKNRCCSRRLQELQDSDRPCHRRALPAPASCRGGPADAWLRPDVPRSAPQTPQACRQILLVAMTYSPRLCDASCRGSAAKASQTRWVCSYRHYRE
jgi:hypothetical protein